MNKTLERPEMISSPVINRLNDASMGSPDKTKTADVVPKKTHSMGLRLEDLKRGGDAKRDIVIGMAQDIDAKNFAVFCFSLRR